MNDQRLSRYQIRKSTYRGEEGYTLHGPKIKAFHADRRVLEVVRDEVKVGRACSFRDAEAILRGKPRAICGDCGGSGTFCRACTTMGRVGEFEPTIEVVDAAYAKGMKLVRVSNDGKFKNRAQRLIGDGLNGRWTNRERGWVVSPAKVRKFERLYAEGWDASAITGELIAPKGA